MAACLALLGSLILMAVAGVAAALSIDLRWARCNRTALVSMALAMAFTGASGVLLGWGLAGGGA